MKTVVTAQLKYPSILENAPSAGQDAARAFLGGGIRPTVSLQQLPKPHGYFSYLYTYYSFCVTKHVSLYLLKRPSLFSVIWRSISKL